MSRGVLIAVSLKALPKTERTNDHIPPKCLFVGFPKEFQMNRKTVKCCANCNNEIFAPLDEEFRNIIGFSYDLNHGNMEITRNSIAQLLKQGRIVRASDGLISITVSKSKIHAFQLRCFKAIYTKTYGEIFNDNDFDIVIIDETSDQDEIDNGLLLQQFVLNGEDWDKSGSTEVFKYVAKKDWIR
jgi:hypothetical protein